MYGNRLNADESIQMVTALALQLIQCVVKLPVSSDDDTEDDSKVSVALYICLQGHYIKHFA